MLPRSQGHVNAAAESLPKRGRLGTERDQDRLLEELFAAFDGALGPPLLGRGWVEAADSIFASAAMRRDFRREALLG